MQHRWTSMKYYFTFQCSMTSPLLALPTWYHCEQLESFYLPTKTSCVAKLEGHLNAQVVSSALKPWRDHPPNSTTCSNFLQAVFQVYATWHECSREVICCEMWPPLAIGFCISFSHQWEYSGQLTGGGACGWTSAAQGGRPQCCCEIERTSV